MAEQTTLHIARQPVFDRNARVVGYELLYRDGVSDNADHADPVLRTVRSVEALIEIGLDKLVGKTRAFLNIDFEIVDYPVLDAFPTNQIVLEILETTESNEINLMRAEVLKQKGFALALDDYAFQPELKPFLPLVDIVKLECSLVDPQKDFAKISMLAAKKKVLAEKVEEEEQYRLFRDMGCEYFQGYYFAKPRLVKGSAVPSNKLALVKLLTRLNDENVNLAEIESIVASDIAFTYKLLRIIQSAHVGGPCTIKTVREAILYLGLRPTASLASLFLASATGDANTELLTMALVRGKMCEELARTCGMPDTQTYFSIGLLSVLDAFLHQPMREVLDSLPLSDEMRNALLDPRPEKGLGGALLCAQAFERGDFSHAAKIGWGMDASQRAYQSGIQWAEITREALLAA